MNVAVSPTERRFNWRRLLLVALLCVLAPQAFAQAPSPADQRAEAVTQVVLGILSYARWPVEPAQLRLCIVGPTQYTDDLVKGTTQATGRPVVVRRLLADHPDIVNACDVAAKQDFAGQAKRPAFVGQCETLLLEHGDLRRGQPFGRGCLAPTQGQQRHEQGDKQNAYSREQGTNSCDEH